MYPPTARAERLAQELDPSSQEAAAKMAELKAATNDYNTALGNVVDFGGTGEMQAATSFTYHLNIDAAPTS